MPKPAALIAAVLLLCASPAWPQTGDAAGDIVKVADAYVAASLAGDAKAVAALYTDDAVEMPPYEPLVKGRPAIEEHYVKLLAGPPKLASFSLTHLETRADGGLGYDAGTYRQTVSDGQGSMTDTGKYVVILERSGSTWKIAYAIYNSDQRPEP